MIDFANVKALTIPEGSVAKIEKIDGSVVWTKPTEEPTINFLECFQNTTNANCVKTGIKPTQNTTLIVEVEALATTNYCGVAGCRDSSHSFCFFTNTGTWRADYYGKQSVSSYTIATGEKVKLQLDGTGFYINDVQYDDFGSVTFQVTQEIWLLGVNNRGSKMNAMNQNFYSAQIKESGVLVRDYRTATDPNGTTCFYESVEHKYYYFDGTNAAA